MIGNDIVDLHTAAAESNWRRPGYLGKLFTPQEQRWILEAPDPDHKVWQLWSAKEAVYKIVNRVTHQRRFAPLAYQCIADGIILHEQTHYYFKSEITSNYIHTIAVSDAALFPQLIITTEKNYQKDEHGLPMIAGKPVSVSHHGRYYAMVKAIN